MLTPPTPIPQDQAWFWTEEWQAGEREADREVAEGSPGRVFDVLPKEILKLDRVVRPDVSHYTYRVSWSTEDDEFVATCREFPSLSWLAASQVEALEGLMALLRESVADMEEQGEAMPSDLGGFGSS